MKVIRLFVENIEIVKKSGVF